MYSSPNIISVITQVAYGYGIRIHGIEEKLIQDFGWNI